MKLIGGSERTAVHVRMFFFVLDSNWRASHRLSNGCDAGNEARWCEFSGKSFHSSISLQRRLNGSCWDDLAAMTWKSQALRPTHTSLTTPPPPSSKLQQPTRTIIRLDPLLAIARGTYHQHNRIFRFAQYIRLSGELRWNISNPTFNWR